MLQDGLSPGEIDYVAKARLEAQKFAIDRETPAVDAGHGVDGSGEMLYIQRFFVQRNTQFLAATQADKIVLDFLRLAEQAVGEGRNQDGGIVVQGQQASQIARIDGIHPGFQNLTRIDHDEFFD